MPARMWVSPLPWSLSPHFWSPWQRGQRPSPGNGTSPFSAPVMLKLIGPFDWSETPGFSGGRGATHVIGGQVYEPGVVGKKVSVLLAKRSGKFKPFVTKTIPSTRKLSFRIKKPRGRYRLKYVFKGADLVAAAPRADAKPLSIGGHR